MSKPQVIFPQRPDVRNEWDSSQAVVNVYHGKEGLERYPDHGSQAVVNVYHGKEGLEIMRPDPDVYILSDSDVYKSGEYNLEQPTVLGKKKQGNALFLIAAVAVVLLLK